MQRLAWLTDLHLNFVEPPAREAFLERVRRLEADAIVVTGDIGEASDVVEFLALLDDAWAAPIYFVLGNHDFYFGSIADVRRQVAGLCRERPGLTYLTLGEFVTLSPGAALVGHDGWADARLGDYERSLVMMNDYRLIAELAGVGKQERWPLLRALGDEAAAHVRRWLPAALSAHEHVILATHVPPLREACWHEGRLSDDEWAPHFTCFAVGQAILQIMREHPTRRLTVLCGHTHGSGETRPLPNVLIRTGGAEYGSPDIVDVLEME